MNCECSADSRPKSKSGKSMPIAFNIRLHMNALRSIVPYLIVRTECIQACTVHTASHACVHTQARTQARTHTERETSWANRLYQETQSTPAAAVLFSPGPLCFMTEKSNSIYTQQTDNPDAHSSQGRSRNECWNTTSKEMQWTLHNVQDLQHIFQLWMC